METTPNYSDNNKGWWKGKEYEEWVVVKYPTVYPKRKLTLIETKAGQCYGETKEGVEIKFDDKIYAYCSTGRLCIEKYEKARDENKHFVESGILKTDNTTILLIGDYTIWFLFSKRYLQWLDKLNPPFLYEYKTGTSIGFCLPLENARRLCLDVHVF